MRLITFVVIVIVVAFLFRLNRMRRHVEGGVQRTAQTKLLFLGMLELLRLQLK